MVASFSPNCAYVTPRLFNSALSKFFARVSYSTVAEAVHYGPPAPAKAPEPAQVYVISAPSHPVKIGIAKDPEKRLAALQTGFPHRLLIHFTASVSNGRSVERACHMTLSANRLEGEWFDVTPDRAIEVVRLAAGVDLAA